MTVYGVDAAWQRPSAAALKAAGYSFISVYLSYDTTGKNATKAEVDAYLAAGLSVILNWEYDEHACRGGFAAGQRDAEAALTQALDLGLPVDDQHPIYFSPDDYDIQAGDKAGLQNYLRACSAVLGGKMRVGHYGGYNGTLWAYQSGYCGWLWQTYAWSGGRWLNVNIRQIENGVYVGGAAIDRDQAMTTNFGQHSLTTTTSTYDEELMSAQDDVTYIRSVLDKLVNESGGPNGKGWALDETVQSVVTKVDSLASMVSAMRTELDAIKAAQASPAPVSVDASQVATQVTNSTVEAIRGLSFKAA